MLKFYFHLQNSESPIIQAALIDNIKLHETGFNSWVSYLKRITSFCNLDHLLYTTDTREITLRLARIKSDLKTTYRTTWKSERTSFGEGKLALLTDLKHNFSPSKYLSSCHNFKLRKAISKMRLSTHRYPIETGRYIGQTRE